MKKLLKNPQITVFLLIAVFWIPAFIVDSLNDTFGYQMDLSDTIAAWGYVSPFLIEIGYIVYSVAKKK